MNKSQDGSYSTSGLIQKELEKQGFRVERLEDFTIAERWHERHFFVGAQGSKTTLNASRLTEDKYLTSLMLERSGVPVPDKRMFSTKHYSAAREYAKEIRDFVIKPVDGNARSGVSVGSSVESFPSCWEKALRHTDKGVLLEKCFLSGTKARYLIVGGKCVGVVTRKPSEITGDGRKNVQQLIDEKNEFRKNNPNLDSNPIIITPSRQKKIRQQGFLLDSIIPSGTAVIIDDEAGLFSGGESHEIFEKTSPFLKKAAEKAAGSIPGLDVAGVDIIASDHFIEEKDYVVIEVDAKPDIISHHYPAYGKPQNVAHEIVKNTLGVSASTLEEYFERKGFSKTITEIPKSRSGNRLVAKEAANLGACVKVNEKGKIACILGNKWFTYNNGAVVTEEHRASRALMHFLKNKMSVKQLLAASNIPVPKGFSISADDNQLIESIIENLSYPVCLKPVSGSRGENVFPSLKSPDELLDSLNIVKKSTKELLIEENVHGFDARITTVFGEFCAGSLRVPPRVIGDGNKTIKQLVEAEIEYRVKKKLARARALTIDRTLVACVESQGFALDSIPEEGFIVHLRKNSNLSTGAEAHDITSVLSSSTKAMFSKIASLFSDTAILGIDVIFSSDPRTSPSNEFKVIEVNVQPGIRGHHHPYSGNSINVAKFFVKKALS